MRKMGVLELLNKDKIFPTGGVHQYFTLKEKYDLCSSELGRSIVAQLIKRLMRRYCADIPVNIDIPKSTVFPHDISGIFISHGAVIGENCTIFQQVTIGSNTIPGHTRNGAPVIGDNVYIGAGAKIIGNCKIGNNVRIGANCIVTEDVPDNATVVLNKPRIIYHKLFRDNTFISFGQRG